MSNEPGPTRMQTPPAWAFAEPPTYVDAVTTLGIKQLVGNENATVQVAISFGVGFPPPAGKHVASIIMIPSVAKALHALLGERLRDAGLLT